MSSLQKAVQLLYMKGNMIRVFLSVSGMINMVYELSLAEFARSQKSSPKFP